MKLSTEANAWLASLVQRVMARHHLGEAERAGVQYELMSHLHAAGEAKARADGRDDIGVGDLQAAVLEAGGEEGLGAAFVAPRARPTPRAGVIHRTAAWVIDFVVIALSWWVLAGMVALTLSLVLMPFGLSTGRFVSDPWDVGFDLMFGRSGPGFAFLGLGALLTLAYYAYFEGRTGQSLGKKVFDLHVRRADGQPMTYREALARNVVKVFPPLLVLDTLFMLVFFYDEKQRVSDRIAGTYVVEVKP